MFGVSVPPSVVTDGDDRQLDPPRFDFELPPALCELLDELELPD
jgi:hypothetical protein